MTTISIIGAGNMATAIGTRAAKHGHTIELMSRDTAKAQALADQIGNGATVGTFGTKPAGDIVIVAVLFGAAVDVVSHYGEALSGKILVDITNPFNADGTGLVTSAGDSVSQQIVAAAPEGTHVVKAFNTILSGVLAEDKPMDAFFVGDSAEAKERVAAFLESMDMRPLDAGGLESLVRLGVGRHPPGERGPQRRWLRRRLGRRIPLKFRSRPKTIRKSGHGKARWQGCGDHGRDQWHGAGWRQVVRR